MKRTLKCISADSLLNMLAASLPLLEDYSGSRAAISELAYPGLSVTALPPAPGNGDFAPP